jgi:hypothetical protein
MKRGFVLDIFTGLVYLFISAIVIYVAYGVMTNVNAGFTASGISNESSNAMSLVTSAMTLLNPLFLFIIVGLFGALIYSAWTIDTNPMLFVISLVLIIPALVLSSALGDVFSSFSNSSSMTSFVGYNFNYISLVFENFDKIAVVLIVVFLIVLYAKARVQQ